MEDIVWGGGWVISSFFFNSAGFKIIFNKMWRWCTHVEVGAAPMGCPRSAADS